VKVLVVFCHPLRDSFTGAAYDRCVCGLRAGGHEVRTIDLYERDVDDDDGEVDLAWCEALAFVYPTWWSGQPALLTGWLQRMTLERRALSHVRRIVAITSHGSSKLTNAVEGESGRHVLTRALRLRANLRVTTRWIALYGIDTCSEELRGRFLDRVERAMRRRRL
jgi:putative NADPH-quinone reductase